MAVVIDEMMMSSHDAGIDDRDADACSVKLRGQAEKVWKRRHCTKRTVGIQHPANQSRTRRRLDVTESHHLVIERKMLGTLNCRNLLSDFNRQLDNEHIQGVGPGVDRDIVSLGGH